MNKLTEIYDSDFHAWIQRHIECLKSGQFDKLDVDNLIEELESMAGRDRRELISHLIILMAHLLKWQFQLKQLTEQWQTYQGSSWRGSILEQRFQLHEQLEESPSLSPFLSQAVEKAYIKAVKLAAKETGFNIAVFPTECPYTIEQLLDEDFYPNG